MLHLQGIGKSFASGSDGGGEQNKIRKKVERLVVAFKRVAKKFHRRMETLVAHRRTGLYHNPLLLSTSFHRTTNRNPSPSATIRNAPSWPPIGPKCHEIKLVFDRLGISFASTVRVPANAPRTRPSRDSIKSIGRVG